MTLEVDVELARDGFKLDARFTTGPGVTALFGRSGSGKTTLVDIIAGLARPDRGRVAIDGAVLADTAANVFVPPPRRRVGYVFQEARLFPHLSVRQNLLYGAWFAGAAQNRPDFERLVALLGLEAMLSRRPETLSGGEKQRVAIGRALFARPRILLMDEPLASLDEARKQEILPLIERLRDESGVPIIYVSHAAAEVARLATSIVVLERGRVVGHGLASEVLARFDLIPAIEIEDAGAIVEATVETHDDAFALTTLRSPAGLWRAPRIKAQPGSRVRLRVRARDVLLSREAPAGLSALNVFRGVVADIHDDGAADPLLRIDCRGDILVARVTRFSVSWLELARGTEAHVIVKAVALDPWSIGNP